LARVESSAIGKRLVRGTFWALAGTIGSRALALASAILAARILGKMHYGEWGIIQSTVGMFGTLAGFGMGTTAAKFIGELRTTDPTRAGKVIALSSGVSWVAGCALAALLALGSSWLSEHALSAPSLTGSLQLSSFLLLLSGVNGAQTGALSGFEAFKSVARINLLTGVLSFPLTVISAYWFGVAGIVVGTSLGQAIGCYLNFLALRRVAKSNGVPISYFSCMDELPTLWKFSVPAVLTQVLISGVNWLAAAMLVRQPNGFAEMGVFNAANQWFNALIWLPYVVNSVSLPMLAERLGANDNRGAVSLLKMSVRMNAAVALPVVGVGCLLSPYIMMTYGSGFQASWPTLSVVLINAGLLALVMPVGQVMSARGHMWLGFSSNLAWALVFLGMNIFLAGWAAFGLASARLFAYAVHGLFVVVYTIAFVNGHRASRKKDRVGTLHEA